MQLFWIATLLLSAVAARAEFWKPWQDKNFPPTGGPMLDTDPPRGDNDQSMTQAPDDGEEGSGGDWPEWDSGRPVWTQEMPPWFQNRPAGRPGSGNPKEQMNGNGRRPWRPFQVSAWGKRPVPRFVPGFPFLGPIRPFGRPSGGSWWPTRNPSTMVFSPAFKVENVTFQNITGVTLKEGENVFLMTKEGRRGHYHRHREGTHGPPENMFQQYVKLIYNATEPNTVSIEYGVLKPSTDTKGSLLMRLGEILGDNPEEDY